MNKLIVVSFTIFSISMAFASSEVPTGVDLLRAVGDGNLDLVKELVKNGAQVNFKDKTDGFTPLLEAAKYGEVDIVDFLLKNGADIKAVDNRGKNSLMWAIIGYGISSNYPRPKGYRHFEVAKLLLERGIDINAKTLSGTTALMAAASRGSSGRFVNLLLDKGADVTIKTEAGESALAIARKNELTPNIAHFEKLMKDQPDRF